MHMHATGYIGKGALCAGVTVTYPGDGFHAVWYGIIFYHVQAAYCHFILLQFVGFAQYYRVAFRYDVGDEHGLAHSDVEPLALAYGIKGVAMMLTHYLPVCQYKIAAIYAVFKAVHIP